MFSIDTDSLNYEPFKSTVSEILIRFSFIFAYLKTINIKLKKFYQTLPCLHKYFNYDKVVIEVYDVHEVESYLLFWNVLKIKEIHKKNFSNDSKAITNNYLLFKGEHIR